MKRFIRFALGSTFAWTILLVSIGAAHAYEPGQQMCATGVQGSDDGVNARCVDGPNRVVAAIGVTNFDDGTSEVSFGVWNRLSDSHEKCNGQVECWAEVGPIPMEQAELPRYETVTSTHHIGTPITFVNNFVCMCT